MKHKPIAKMKNAIIKRKFRISAFWLLPFVALLIAGWLFYSHWEEQGAEITIEFQSAPGIVAGRTPIRYQGVEVGMVNEVSLSQDLQRIIVKANIYNDMTQALNNDTQFWLVTPKASLAGVSGLDALVGGNYIGIQPGINHDPKKGNKTQRQFTALPSQPKLPHESGERVVQLYAQDLGSLNNDSPIYYRKVKVGNVYSYQFQPSSQGVVIEALIKAPYANLVKQDSQFWNVSGVQGEFSLQEGISVKMESVSSFINGAIAFDSPEDSQPAAQDQSFNLLSQSPDERQRRLADAFVFRLNAPETYGVNAGQPILYRGVQIGEISQRVLHDEQVEFTALVYAQYQQFLHENSLFAANSRVDMRVGLSGVQIQGATPSEWIEGGIHLIDGTKGKKEPRLHYTLYRNNDNAKAGIIGDSLPVTLTLNASTLPDIQAGSVILYHQFQVGEIVNVRPKANMFEVDIHIMNNYRHLLTPKSVFWAVGAARVELNGAGLSIQATPLNRALKGAISFDNLDGVKVNAGELRTLYPNETQARAIGSQITLKTFDASKLSEGMPIRYLGIDIGQVESLKLSTNNREVMASAVLYPQYVQTFSRVGSRFAIVSPEISSSGITNLETIIQPYINAEPGNGNHLKTFELQTANITDSRYLDGLTIQLDATDVGSLQVGTPVLFRGMEVGTVTGFRLGELSDRVYISLRINKKYQYLVRDNTQFWLASGYNISFGFGGGMMKSGTLRQFIRGGISFATPPTTPLAPVAQKNKHFLLQTKEPKDWLVWGSAIPQRQ